MAIPASRILRVTAASQPWKNRDDEWRDRWSLGEVLAGPPML